jgi:hypothetical protein
MRDASDDGAWIVDVVRVHDYWERALHRSMPLLLEAPGEPT